MKRKRKRKRIDLDRLTAAYQAGGFGSWLHFAKRARVSHATVSRIRSGGIKEVRPRTLERMAQALHVPSEWLTRERKGLPYIPESTVLNANKKEPTLWARPTAFAVRQSWLMQRIDAALRRDVDRWFGDDATEVFDSWSGGFLHLFDELSNSISWRTLSLQPAPEGSWHAVFQSDHAFSIDWVAHLLEPWFAGTAHLSADRLLGLFRVVVSNPHRALWSEEAADAKSVRALKMYGAASKRFTGRQSEAPGATSRGQDAKVKRSRRARERDDKRRGGRG